MRIGTLSKVLLAGALALTTVGAAAAPALAAPAPAPQPAISSAAGTMTSTVQGSFTDALGGVGAVTGSFTPTRFSARKGKVFATGTLTSTLTDSTGVALGTVQRKVSLPVTLPAAGAGEIGTQAICPVLNLVLGPLDLDLLGLRVHLDRVVLIIVAESGPGNLLGNLLCAITNLLNGGLNLPLSQIVILLNQILAILQL